MTNEEREALIARARATQCHETCDETNHRMVDALLSALDEARGQLAALHAAGEAHRATRAACDAEAGRPRASQSSAPAVRLLKATEALDAALARDVAAAKAHEARVREPVERERDAAVARADAAETELAEVRAFHEKIEAAARKSHDVTESERDTLAAALAEVMNPRGIYDAWTLNRVLRRLADAADHLLNDHSCDAHGYEGVVCARDAARDHADAIEKLALPADLAAQRDARVRAEALREARSTVVEMESRAWARADGARSDRVPIAAERHENKAEALSDAAEALRKLLDEAEKGGA